jgi:hypothetical protein
MPMATAVVAGIMRPALIAGIVQPTEYRGMAVEDILAGGRVIRADPFVCLQSG